MTSTPTESPAQQAGDMDGQLHSTMAAFRKLPLPTLRRQATILSAETMANRHRLAQQAATLIFAGAIPTNDDLDLLVQNLPSPQATAAGFLWEFFGYTKIPTVPNRFTCRLADIMAAGTENDKTIWDAMGNIYSIERSIPQFAETFGNGYMRTFIDNLTRRRLRCPLNFYEAARPFLTDDDIRKLRPSSPRELAWVAKALGDRMGNEFGELASDACHDITDYHIQYLDDMLVALQEKHFQYIGAHWRKIFPPLTIDMCKEIVALQRPPENLLNSAVKHLAQSKANRRHDIAFGGPYAIPHTLSGKTLAQILVYLERSVRNPRGMIKDLPSEQQLRSRTIELQLAHSNEEELFTAAIEARDRLEKSADEGSHACNRLLQMLIQRTDNPQALEGFVQKTMRSPLGPAEATLLLGCLFDVVAYRKRLKDHNPAFVDVRQSKFDYMDWTSKPSEKTSTRLCQAIIEVEMERTTKQEGAIIHE